MNPRRPPPPAAAMLLLRSQVVGDKAAYRLFVPRLYKPIMEKKCRFKCVRGVKSSARLAPLFNTHTDLDACHGKNRRAAAAEWCCCLADGAFLPLWNYNTCCSAPPCR